MVAKYIINLKNGSDIPVFKEIDILKLAEGLNKDRLQFVVIDGNLISTHNVLGIAKATP